MPVRFETPTENPCQNLPLRANLGRVKSLRPERAKKFAAKFVSNGFSPADAVILCGWTQNRRSAYVIAYRLLENVITQREIKRLMTKDVLTAQDVLVGLSDKAKADIADVLESDGSFDIARAKERNKSKLIKSLKFDKDSGKVVGLELYSAHEAERDLGKFHKLFTERVETTDTNQNTQLLLKSIEAIAAREDITTDQAATELYSRLKDEIPLESWPAQFHNVLRESQDKPQDLDTTA